MTDVHAGRRRRLRTTANLQFAIGIARRLSQFVLPAEIGTGERPQIGAVAQLIPLLDVVIVAANLRCAAGADLNLTGVGTEEGACVVLRSVA